MSGMALVAGGQGEAGYIGKDAEGHEPENDKRVVLNKVQGGSCRSAGRETGFRIGNGDHHEIAQEVEESALNRRCS